MERTLPEATGLEYDRLAAHIAANIDKGVDECAAYARFFITDIERHHHGDYLLDKLGRLVSRRINALTGFSPAERANFQDDKDAILDQLASNTAAIVVARPSEPE